MAVTPYNERPSSQLSLAAGPELPHGQPHDDDRKEQAIAQLVEHGVLSHAFGRHGEYKVRTTMTTRQNWQYRCCVLRHGKAIKGAFLPLIVEHQSPFHGVSMKLQGVEDIRLSFAQEAVDVHFTRCAALQEYLVLSALYDQPLSQSRRRYILLVPLIGIAAAVVYGFWAHAFRTDSGALSNSPSLLVADRLPSREPGGISPPASGSTTSRNGMSEQGDTSGPVDLAEAPKAMRLNDLIAMQDPPQRADRASRAVTPAAAVGSTMSDIQAGDVVLLTGWIHRVFRAPDNTYRLHVSPNRSPGARELVALAPPPEQAPDSSTVQTQLQTVRTFIRQQLLRQQEPSPRGSVMQRPILVQLTGRLSNPVSSLGGPAPGKQSKGTAARWEISPVLEVRFATSSQPADRSPSQ
jgi:hypothetical protein